MAWNKQKFVRNDYRYWEVSEIILTLLRLCKLYDHYACRISNPTLANTACFITTSNHVPRCRFFLCPLLRKAITFYSLYKSGKSLFRFKRSGIPNAQRFSLLPRGSKSNLRSELANFDAGTINVITLCYFVTNVLEMQLPCFMN